MIEPGLAASNPAYSVSLDSSPFPFRKGNGSETFKRRITTIEAVLTTAMSHQDVAPPLYINRGVIWEGGGGEEG